MAAAFWAAAFFIAVVRSSIVISRMASGNGGSFLVESDSDGSEILAYDSEVSEEIEYQGLTGLNVSTRMHNSTAVKQKDKTLMMKEGKRSDAKTPSSSKTGTPSSASKSKSTPASKTGTPSTASKSKSTPASKTGTSSTASKSKSTPARPAHLERRRLPENSGPSSSYQSEVNNFSLRDNPPSDTNFQAEVKSDHSQITHLLKNLVKRVENLEDKRGAGPSTSHCTPQKPKIPLIIRVS